MPETDELGYKIKKHQRLAVVDDLRVSILTLAEADEVPWHRHTNIDDDFFCMEGPMKIETRQPEGTRILQPGETFKVAAGQPHRVSGLNNGGCKFMIMQGVGKYDFDPEQGNSAVPC